MTRFRTIPGVAVAFALATLACVGEASAQDTVTVRGRVVDAVSGGAIPGVVVQHLGSGITRVTDAWGVFVLDVPASGSYTVRLEQLGYEVSQALLPSTAPLEATTIRLRPKPIELEGFRVVVDAFQERRRFAFRPVEVLAMDSLWQADGTAYDIVKDAVPTARMCVEDMGHLCFYRRGWRRISICVDEMRAYQGALLLERHRPWDLYMVEIYDGGAQVRVYTRRFVERLRREGRSLRPLQWGCS